MSTEIFFASNARLKKKDNPYVKRLSINEALAAGADFDMYLLEGFDHDEPELILWCEREELTHFPSVWECDPWVEHPDSDKKYFAMLGGDPLMDLPGITEYIYQHMMENEDVNELELWCVWLGDEDEPYVDVSCKLELLTPETLGKFFAEPYKDFKLTIVR